MNYNKVTKFFSYLIVILYKFLNKLKNNTLKVYKLGYMDVFNL